MKKSVEMRSEHDLLKTHDVQGTVPCWHFRIKEKSAEHREVENWTYTVVK